MEKYKHGEKDFNIDVVAGELGEKDMVLFFISLGFEFVEQTQGYDNRWDLVMSYKGVSYTIEIKTDIYKKDTGNIAIEYECRGKPSGVNVTKAYLFVNFFPHFEEVWIMRTHELKDLIEKSKPYKFLNGGDKGSNTKLYLMNKNKVRGDFKVFKWSKV